MCVLTGHNAAQGPSACVPVYTHTHTHTLTLTLTQTHTHTHTKRSHLILTASHERLDGRAQYPLLDAGKILMEI